MSMIYRVHIRGGVTGDSLESERQMWLFFIIICRHVSCRNRTFLPVQDPTKVFVLPAIAYNYLVLA